MATDPILERLSGLHPRAVDLSLGRMRRLLERLGGPERRLPPVIHVAGTNGKGSVVAMLRAIHEAAGRRVHAYTSPHLVRFAERFVVAGAEIADAELSDLLLECERVNAGAAITQFEIATAAGLLAFSRTPADLLLLEVGLGGRFDATNVVDRPALTAIASISMDHQRYLGDTLEAIAGEKAGILKPGVPAVTGRQSAAALAVLRDRAAAAGAPLAARDAEWSVEAEAGGLVFRAGNAIRRVPPPALRGAHQVDNAGVALAAVEALQRAFPVSASALERGLRSARWPARLQRLVRGPMVEAAAAGTEIWLDGGHNADAGRAMAAELAGWRRARPGLPVALVFGALDTRDPEDYLRHFAGLVEGARTVAIPGAANTLGAEAAARAARRAGLDAAPAADAVAAARALSAGPGGARAILVCGSLYLAGAVLADHG